MTDQELLELAAKAAGIRGRFTENHPEDGAPCYSSGINIGQRLQILWNPLKDDGDALRLMHAIYRKTHPGDWIRVYDNLWYGSLEDSRRAIVRAAAEIGKSMEKSQ